jgi:hypothetical protein
MVNDISEETAASIYRVETSTESLITSYESTQGHDPKYIFHEHIFHED